MYLAVAFLWAWSGHARWNRIDIDYRQIGQLFDDNGRPYMATESYRGILLEGGSIVVYRMAPEGIDDGPRSSWEFNERVVGRNLRQSGQWYWTASQPSPFGKPDGYMEAGVRAWLVVAVLAGLPAAWLGVRIRRGVRVRRGHCFNCGYDLRASPERCPECGTSIPSNAGTPT